MSVMRKMRKAGTNRVFYIILTILISIGLVGGYAAFSTSSLNSQTPTGTQGTLAPSGPDQTSLETNIRRYKQVLKASPRNLEVLVDLGNAQYDLGVTYSQQGREADAVRELKGAVESYGKALEIDPQNVDVRVDMATAAFYASDYQVAQEQFKKAIEINPNHVYGRMNYGVFLAQAVGDSEAAVHQWEAALATKPDPGTEARIRNLIKEYKK
ncbi:hypothetical protein SY88_03785 [Clostridiales bacterium PH28_bin88]|nr:hypothetical protein SY88_03785 [Clostridiales bacterium PH28_bin88]